MDPSHDGDDDHDEEVDQQEEVVDQQDIDPYSDSSSSTLDSSEQRRLGTYIYI